MTRTLQFSLTTLALLVLSAGWALAADQPLTRADVKVIKHKLVAVVEALGTPPAGYGKAAESFELPTTIAPAEAGTFYPAEASATLNFEDDQGKNSPEAIQAEYQRKMLAAQAAGDYQKVSALAQEMMQKASQAQMQADANHKEPITVHIRLNTNPYAAIDPDAVVFEGPGVIALKSSEAGNDTLTVRVFLDPVKLKQTETLAAVDLSADSGSGVKSKTAARNMEVEYSGPATVVEAWSKKLDTGKALAQLGN